MEKSILPQGTGTPYIALYDGSNKPIIDLYSRLPIGVFATSFKFVQEEGKTKEAEIVLKVPHRFAVDSKNISSYAPIKIVYGWIYPDSTYTFSPSWNLMVIGREVSYTPSGVDITLKLSDKTTLYKNAPSAFPDNLDTNIDIIKKLLVGKEAVFLQLVDYQSLYTEVKYGVAEKENTKENGNQQ